MENSCVVCGCYIPEGDHVCKFCRITEDNEHTIRFETPPNIISIDTTVTPINFRVDTTAELIVQFAKYYIFNTNMTSYGGTFSYSFIKMNKIGNETVIETENRLQKEYEEVCKNIESLIIK